MPWSPLNKKYLLPILESIKDRESITTEELRQVFVSETLMMSVNTFKRFVEGLILLGVLTKTYDPFVYRVNAQTIENLLKKYKEGE